MSAFRQVISFAAQCKAFALLGSPTVSVASQCEIWITFLLGRFGKHPYGLCRRPMRDMVAGGFRSSAKVDTASCRMKHSYVNEDVYDPSAFAVASSPTLKPCSITPYSSYLHPSHSLRKQHLTKLRLASLRAGQIGEIRE